MSDNWLCGPSPGPRLIVVCGLPGSGKICHAKQLEAKLRAVRFCPDEWMRALEIDLYDGKKRDRIEALQWTLAQELRTLGQTVIIEWGTLRRFPPDQRIQRTVSTLSAGTMARLIDGRSHTNGTLIEVSENVPLAKSVRCRDVTHRLDVLGECVQTVEGGLERDGEVTKV